MWPALSDITNIVCDGNKSLIELVGNLSPITILVATLGGDGISTEGHKTYSRSSKAKIHSVGDLT